MPKLVVFDVDGTLLDEAGVCRPRTLAVLERLRRCGIVVALATGRPHAVAGETLGKVGGADFIVCGNGASLYDTTIESFLHDTYLPDEVIAPLVADMRQRVPGTRFALELATSMLVEDGFARRVPESSQPAPVPDVLDALPGSARVRRLISFHNDFDDDLAALAAAIEPLIDQRCRVTFGMLPIVDVAPAGSDKAVALEVLAEHLGVDATDTIAFGDAGNDIEMLRWAGTGVAMGNAGQHVRAAADLVTAPIELGGVADYLEPLLDEIEADDVAYG